MSFKLTVTKESDAYRLPDEYVFDQDAVVIGRDSLSDLTLPDPQRVVSKQHARIERQGTTYFVTDLGSKNLTFLNQRRLDANRPYPFQEGDQLKIGDFTVQLAVVQPQYVAPDFDRTIIHPGFINPFNDDARLIAEALSRMSRAFTDEPERRRGEALREALEDALFGQERGEVAYLLADVVAPDRPAAAPQGYPATPEMPPAHAPQDWDRTNAGAPYVPAAPGYPGDYGGSGFPAQPGGYPAQHGGYPPQQGGYGPAQPGGYPAQPGGYPSQQGGYGPAQPGAPAQPPRAGFGPAAGAPAGASTPHVQVVDLLVDSVVRLVKGLWQFRLEFMGQTIVETPGMISLHSSSPEEVKAYLLEPGIAQDERNKRLGLVEHAAHDVIVHQVALLEGYKSSIREGVESVLKEIDPERLEAELEKEGGRKGFNLFGGKDRLAERFRQKYHELTSEHRSAFEKRFFRPTFIRTYLKTVASAQQDLPRGKH